MSLSQRLSQASNSGRGLPCPVATVLRSLDKADAEALVAALECSVDSPERLYNTTIQQALLEDGFPVHLKGIEKHRRRICRCWVGTPK